MFPFSPPYRFLRCLAAVGPLLLGSPGSLYAQGTLTPPGAPGPTMKTLDQVEARTLVASLPFTIAARGSYYLTGNLNVATGTAITINADDVTLDLNGFTLASTASPASGSGISVSAGRTNVTIRRGRIAGTTTLSGSTFTGGGFVNGVTTVGIIRNLRVSELEVRAVSSQGIDLDGGSTDLSQLVERCQVTLCGGAGIRAAIARDCSVDRAGGTGIAAAVVQTCHAQTVSTASSIHAIDSPGSVEASRGIAAAGTGIAADTVTGSTGISDSSSGINAKAMYNCIGTSTSGTGLAGLQATNCRGASTSGSGLVVTNAANCDGFSVTGSFGLRAQGTASYCRGQRDGGVALSAPIAIGCTVQGTGTVSSASRHLGTP